jgi:DNA topoisomerase-1
VTRINSKPVEALVPDPVDSAREAGLRYVDDTKPGIRRVRKGKGFVFVRPDGTKPEGKKLDQHDDYLRILALAIPPAWTAVWICPDPRGHIQATGRDARGRKQYRYHAKWREVRDGNKYDKMISFAQALPQIRRRVQQDLKRAGLPREKVLAAVVRLLETTLIRVGNDEYAKHNESFGLTTMRDKHVEVKGARIRFDFNGKSRIKHEIDLEDTRLARIVKECQGLPGFELFQYLDDEGKACDVGSADVNEYLRSITGQDFTAKDFRTWAGTMLAAMALREFEAFSSRRQANRNIVAAVESVAKKLGNTKAVCRKCYIHPVILDSYLDGSLVRMLKKRVERRLTKSLHSLRPEEAAVLGVLQQRLARDAGKGKGMVLRRKAG